MSPIFAPAGTCVRLCGYFDLDELSLFLSFKLCWFCANFLSSRRRFWPVCCSLPKWISSADKPWFLIRELTKWTALASMASVTFSASGQSFRSSASSSWWALSTDAIEFLFSLSPHSMTMSNCLRSLSSFFAKDFMADALSTLIFTAEWCLMGWTVVTIAFFMSFVCSDSAIVAIVRHEKRSRATKMFCFDLLITSALKTLPGCSGSDTWWKVIFSSLICFLAWHWWHSWWTWDITCLEPIA